MAKKVTLGNRPKCFKEIDVKAVLPDGEEGLIPVTYKYRTQTEYGAWVDGATAKSKARMNEGSGGDDKEFSWEEFFNRNREMAVDQLLDAVDAWGLDAPLNRQSLLQMADETPACIIAMLTAYGNACRDGRLGN